MSKPNQVGPVSTPKRKFRLCEPIGRQCNAEMVVGSIPTALTGGARPKQKRPLGGPSNIEIG